MNRPTLSRFTPIEVNCINHIHGGIARISRGFRPPVVPAKLTFDLTALSASIARTETLRRVSARTRFFLGIKAFIEARLLIENRPSFTLSRDFPLLADAARTSFAGSVGVGIADLVMNQMGYIWRDNAQSLCITSGSRPDFIYGGGPAAGHGMVIVEAHGSFAKDIDSRKITKRTNNKYVRQIISNLAVFHKQYGNVVNGYCIGFGSKPGQTGSFICVADTSIPTAQHGQPYSAGSVFGNPPIPLVLATFRANFSLLNATRIVRWIECILFDVDRPRDISPVEFEVISYADTEFVIFPIFYHHLFLGNIGVFAIVKQACQHFLDYLAQRISGKSEISTRFIEIFESEIAGFSSTELKDTGYIRYRDGLAFLVNPSKMEPKEKLVWDPHSGCRTE